MLSKLTIVLGGAASGKSSYSEDLVNRTGLPKVYIASAQAYDVEMEEKIADHRTARGAGWETVEAPIEVAKALRDQAEGKIILFDCATMWLSNILLADHDLEAAVQELTQALKSTKSPVVVVTNETGQGIVPENALARRFRNAQGRLNQHLAAEAETVIAVMAGLPLALKGSLP